MNNSDFNIESEGTISKKKFVFIKKILIIALIVVVVLVSLYLFINNLNNSTYTLEFEAPEVMYMEEPLAIPVKIKGPDKYLDEIVTAYFASSDEIINIPENEFEGSSGKIILKPVSPGEEKITISSSIGTDEYSKELVNKTFSITVCPKFNDSLVTTKDIYIKKSETKALDINFGYDACSKIVTYESQNENIVKVDSEGLITPVSIGETKVVVSNGSNAILINVSVVNK